MRNQAKREGWGPSLTKQSARDECNINVIVKRFTKTGQLTHISDGLGEYRDMSGIPDLHEAMNIVADANSLFMELPAEIRKACGHDASNFIDFIDDEENFDQCVEWGLLAPKENQLALDTTGTTDRVSSKTKERSHEATKDGKKEKPETLQEDGSGSS